VVAARARRGARRAHPERCPAGRRGWGLWRELAEVLTDERKRLIAAGAPHAPAEPERFGALSRELAALSERRLGDRPRALACSPRRSRRRPRSRAARRARRLAAEHDQRSSWKALLEAYDTRARRRDPDRGGSSSTCAAPVARRPPRRSQGAVGDVLAAFSWAPDRDDIRDALVALAGKARAWNELTAVDSALIERAPSAPAAPRCCAARPR